MVLKHIRHIVRIYGDKRLLLGNESYYDSINETAEALSEEMNIPHSFMSRLHNDQTSEICQIVSPSLEYSERLADKLKSLNLYQEVKVESQEFDIEKIMKERGMDPDDLESLF